MLEDRVVLISGGSGGIGRGVAERCAAHGARVLVGWHASEAAARALADRLPRARALPFDVGAATADLMEALIAEEGRLDGYVHCAGVHGPGPLASLSDEEIRRQLDVNLRGAVTASQAVLRPMSRQRAGSIVLVGSVAAHRVTRGHAVYSAAKAGLEGFARALASEMARRGVRVNCVLPGPVDSPMLAASIEETGDDPSARVPMGRTIGASEVGEAVAWLLSDRASAVTGASLPVDGGYLLW